MPQNPSISILVGDVRDRLKELPDQSVHCVITSPPYWGQRKYESDDGMIGMEDTWEEHLASLLDVFAEVRRVLRDDGTLWLNYGDVYWGGKGKSSQAWSGSHTDRDTLMGDHHHVAGKGETRPTDRKHDFWKPKDLMMLPARLAIALQEQGWWLRSEIVWCLSGETRLWAETSKGVGVHTLEALARRDPSTVRLWNGQQWTQVLAWTRSVSDGEALKIGLRSGEQIVCTPDHLWPVDGENVAARDLRLGDVLETCVLPSEGEEGHAQDLTVDDLWFAGLWLASGSSTDDGVFVPCGPTQLPRWTRLVRFASEHGMTTQHKGEQAALLDDAAAADAVLRAVFIGDTPRTARLRPEIWGCDDLTLTSFMDGYLEGLGTWVGGGQWYLELPDNEGWVADLRTIAARLGAGLTLLPEQIQTGGVQHGVFRGDWCWSRKNPQGLGEPRSEVVSINRSELRVMWDVTVADEPHLFALASGVLTHNSKPNPKPESVLDRPTCAHEKVLLLSKSKQYFYDAEAVRTPQKPASLVRARNARHTEYNPHVDIPTESLNRVRPRKEKRRGHFREEPGLQDWDQMSKEEQQASGANMRNVWEVATRPYPKAHFATFPPDLVEPPLKAGTSEHGVCAECGTPFRRIIEKEYLNPGNRTTNGPRSVENRDESAGFEQRLERQSMTVGWEAGCECGVDRVPATVLDPFGGAGTVALVAQRLGRSAVLVEISAKYAAMSKDRIQEAAPLFADITVFGDGDANVV